MVDVHTQFNHHENLCSDRKNQKPLTTETQRHREKAKERKTKDFWFSL
jgi:hypothetical protein